MNGNDEVVFIEHEAQEVSDKPHCGDCFSTEAPGVPEVTDKPHCGDC